MAISAVLGDGLVSVGELDERAQEPPLHDFLAKESFDSDFTLTLGSGREVRASQLTRAFEVRSPRVPFEGIGLGKPLTIVLEQVYLGNYPDTMRWLPGEQEGDVIVTSAHKSFQTFEAAPRAIHMMETRPDRCGFIRQKATESGSRLVYYSPGVTDDSVLLTVEMAVDREFDKQLGQTLGKAFAAAGALPVFATAAPFLLAAGVAIPIAQDAISLLARPKTFFEATQEIALDRPGIPTFQTHEFVAYPDGQEAEFEGFTLRSDFRLEDGEGNEYAGDVPYVVLTFDGTPQEEYEGWGAEAASAAVLERFFAGGETLTAAMDVVGRSLSLFNDVRFQQRAADAKKRSTKAKGREREKVLKLYEAYKKNVKDETLRSTLD